MSAQSPRPWQAARRILGVRLDSLGDVLMCTPAIRALRQSLPGCRLTLLGSPSGAAAAPCIPALDAAVSVRAPWMKHDQAIGAQALQECAAQLAAQRFDAAVMFTWYSQSCWRPQRTGRRAPTARPLPSPSRGRIDVGHMRTRKKLSTTLLQKLKYLDEL